MTKLTIALAMVIIAVLSTASPVFGQTKDAGAQAQLVATQRSQSVMQKNRAQFMDTIDPDASQQFKDAQAKLFAGLTSLPLSKYDVELSEADSGNLAPGLDLDRKYKTDTYMAATRVMYRLGQYDDRDGVDVYWYTYVKRNDRWYITADSDAAVIGLDSAQSLWDRGALNVQASPQALVITTADNQARGQQLLSMASDAMTLFASRWNKPWNGRVVVIDPGTASEAQRLVKTSGDVANFSAFTVYTPLRTDGWSTTAPRIFAQDANLADESPQLQRETFVHEFTHYAESTLAGPATPTWLHEGTAEWVRLAKPAAVNPIAARPALPTAVEFTGGTAAQIGQAYKSATSAVAYISSLKGADAPIDLFENVGARRLTIGSPANNVNTALAQTVGLNVQQFTAQWDAKYPRATNPNTTSAPAG